ncbi:MAG: DUF523 and DUF1722 domain-containing protein [Candidatus Omnitrophica bacterium]|nr:DUF523 and DUF1722 domain-containing protein [Candidatus Omnitrophota bacterium]
MNTKKIRVGISSCLLGQKVRYDGGHKLDHYLRDTLGQYIEWVPVCPEVECGLPVPREAMRLVGSPAAPRLMTSRTGRDLTEQMRSWAARRVLELEKEELCGFVFRTGSPSSGMRGVKVYNNSGVIKQGVGMFARQFMDHFPLVPVEDDGRLNDAALRENFIERLFVFKQWQDFLGSDGSIKGLVKFHTEHKLLIMAHNPRALMLLGRFVAHARKYKRERLLRHYFAVLMEACKCQTSVKKNRNVLQHIMGYFKKDLSAAEKKELAEVITHYSNGFVPLIVPITLLRHYVKKYEQPYLITQRYLEPHPMELMLRNHV